MMFQFKYQLIIEQMLRPHPSCALDINKQNPSEIFYMHDSVSDCIYSNQERNLINTTNFIAFMFLSVYSSKYVSKLM